MRERMLYILVFKDEPLVKVGFSVNAYLRAIQLGSRERFDLRESYLIQATDFRAISLLEKTLKTFFAEERAVPKIPITSGKTETFHHGVLPRILETIDSFKKHFPSANFSIKRDLSEFMPSGGRRRIVDREPVVVVEVEKSAKDLIDELKQLNAEGMSQAEIARVLEVPRQRVHTWFKAGVMPKLEVGLKIERLLKGRK